jgi:hypothetical protein
MVGTAGIIACDYVDGRTTLDCSLGDTTIRDTVLSNLTFAVSLSATATKLRLQDNRVDGCVAGLWYLLPEAAVPASPAANTTGFYPEVFLFGEFSLCAVLFEISPPPQSPADATRLAAPVESNATAGVFALIIRGNEVDPTAGQSQAAGATTALLLALNGEQRTIPETFGELSVIVADNYLRSASGANAAAALLTLPSSQPCAITGNVIVNIGLALQDGNVSYGPSLWLTVAYSGESTAPGTLLLTVTGNTLFNKSDLRALIRYGSNPPAGWESFNSDGL